MKKKPGFLEELFGLDAAPLLLFPDKKKKETPGRKKPLSGREECPNCGSLFRVGGFCPGCGMTDEEMPWGEH